MSDQPAADFGVIGLGVMGSNLALNFADHGLSLAVWNHSLEHLTGFLARNAGGRFVGARELRELVGALSRPRRILMMVSAGQAVDSVIGSLRSLLERGDILIDGGNSWYGDTQRRGVELGQAGIAYFGCGVSGGEEGARHGPSLMPGGPRESYREIAPALEAIAARTEAGACVTYVGPDGAGHFVKMVHNGIEYGDMQLIAEVYDVLRKALGLGAERIAAIFARWNEGPLESFLIDLTAKVLVVRDEAAGAPLVDLVLDVAGQKGTGKWTVQAALDLGVPVPTIGAALDARDLSALRDERLAASAALPGPQAARSAAGHPEEAALIADLQDALLGAKICAYAQGMKLIAAASAAHAWGIDLAEMARIWKGGCIIRARLLDGIRAAFQGAPALASLLRDPEMAAVLRRTHPALRRACAAAQAAGVPVPALGASLAYYDGYRSSHLPQNLTQSQRDAFGAHTYVRADHPERGAVHTPWLTLAESGAILPGESDPAGARGAGAKERPPGGRG